MGKFMGLFPGGGIPSAQTPGVSGGGASDFSELTGLLALAQINASGTPSASNFLRGDGSWAEAGDGAASHHTRHGDGTKGSTNDNIVKFGTAVGTPDSSVVSHNDLAYLTDGSIFTLLEDGVYDIRVSTAAATAGFGVYILSGTSPDNTLQTIIGGETQPTDATLCSFTNSRKVKFSAGDKIWVYCDTALADYAAYNYLHAISIVKLTKGQKGDTGATGAAGAGAVPWQSVTQASNGNSLTLTLDPVGDLFEIVGENISNSASSANELEFNGSTGGHSYRHLFSAGEDANAGGYFPPGVVGSGVTCYFHGFVYRQGETITAALTATLPDSENSVSVVKKTITGATAITSLRLLSSQANGIGAGSFVKMRKVS